MLVKLSNVYQAQGRYAEAIPGGQRAMAIYEKALQPDDPSWCTLLTYYAELLFQTGRQAEAAGLADRARTIREQLPRPTSSN